MWFLIVKGVATFVREAWVIHILILFNRSVQTAVQISLAALGGIIGTVVFRAQDAPRFIPGGSKEFPDPFLLLMRH